jgi:hypothetical protein
MAQPLPNVTVRCSAAESAKHVLSATQSRSSVPRQLPPASPMRAPAAAPAPFVPPRQFAAAQREPQVDGPSRSDTLRPSLQTHGGAGASSGQGSTAYFGGSGSVGGDDGVGTGGRPRSPELRRLRAQMLSDPEPEKVLGLVEQVREGQVRNGGWEGEGPPASSSRCVCAAAVAWERGEAGPLTSSVNCTRPPSLPTAADPH